MILLVLGGQLQKFVLFLFVFTVLLSSSLSGKKVAVITEVLKPSSITIDDYLYINEGTTIYIYDKNTYKFISKFGKAGEGPQEFRIFAAITP